MSKNVFPDGTPISDWFENHQEPVLQSLGKQYLITDYGVRDDGKIYTKEIQSIIDTAAKNGGGVIYVPEGTFITGALFFKEKVHLYIAENGTLLGSDDISDYPLCSTRIEGETCTYYPALINADNIDGFCLFGKGTIDGNGLKSWKAFWLRYKWNPNCTNKDEQRPRLVYLSNCTNAVVSGLRLQNSHFWTTHFYKCRNVKVLGCNIFSPASPTPAPSTDAVDIDVCTDFLIKNCKFEVNDDGIALKGGKGPYADTMEENGSNQRIIIEDCEFGFCHSCLTCGSESIHNRNVIMRRISVAGAAILLRLKMRPDTPQHYEYVSVQNATGKVGSFIHIRPWTQFFDLKGRKDMPVSRANNIYMSDCDCECSTFFNVEQDEGQYILSDFNFENLNICAKNTDFPTETVKNFSASQVLLKKYEVQK